MLHSNKHLFLIQFNYFSSPSHLNHVLEEQLSRMPLCLLKLDKSNEFYIKWDPERLMGERSSQRAPSPLQRSSSHTVLKHPQASVYRLFLMMMLQACTRSDGCERWHASGNTHWTRPLRRPRPQEVAVWRLVQWCHSCQLHGVRRDPWVSLNNKDPVFQYTLHFPSGIM